MTKDLMVKIQIQFKVLNIFDGKAEDEIITLQEIYELLEKTGEIWIKRNNKGIKQWKNSIRAQGTNILADSHALVRVKDGEFSIGEKENFEKAYEDCLISLYECFHMGFDNDIGDLIFTNDEMDDVIDEYKKLYVEE